MSWTGTATFVGRMPLRPRRRSAWLWLGAGWGLLGNFSAATGPTVSQLLQGAGVALALAGIFLSHRVAKEIPAALKAAPVVLISLHCVGAVASGIWASSDIAAVVRYALLVPVVLTLHAAVRADEQVERDLRDGLVAAGAVFVGYHLVHLEPGSLLDPVYRISLFLNTNVVGFIAAMTAVALLSELTRADRERPVIVSAATCACVVLVFATKSRTATLALAAGTLVLACMWRSTKRLAFRSVAVGFVAAAAFGLLVHVTDVGQRLGGAMSAIYMLNEGQRSVETGNSRFEVWRYVISTVWLPNPVLGVGPGNHSEIVAGELGVSSAHNGWLANVAETGLLGTLPLVFFLLVALSGVRRAEARHVFPILCVGVVESGAETMLFSMGSSASLLFMYAMVKASARPKPLPGKRTGAATSVARA